jgi:hypothetical protein
MATYTNITCSYCRASLTGGYTRSSGVNSKLGVPYIQCFQCKKLMRTGKKPWSQLKSGERFIEVSRGVFLSLTGGLLFGFGVFLLFYFVSGNKNPSIGSLIVCGIIGQAISAWRSVSMYQKAIPQIEQITQEERWDEPVMPI